MGNDIGLGPARSVVYVRKLDLDNNFSNTFSSFQLEYRLPHKILELTIQCRLEESPHFYWF